MKNLYTIKDTKLGFETIFIAPNNMSAIRLFADSCQDKDTMFAKHPEDFELYHVGKMDSDTGDIESKVSFLEKATTFVK